MADTLTRFSCLLGVGTSANAASALDAYVALSEEDTRAVPLARAFRLSIEPEHGPSQLWIRDEDGGDPQSVIRFALHCVRLFSLTGLWGFAYAVVASRPEPDAIGGGAHVLDLGVGRVLARAPGSAGSSWRATSVPEIVETTVYRIDELSEAAKETARDWFRRIGFEHDWHEAVIEDFGIGCAILGIELRTVPVRLFGGGTRGKPCIFFSGFWSQGDGACFEGRYAHAKAAPTHIPAHAPQDADLHAIADALQVVQRRNFHQLRADVRHRGRYYHEHSMVITVEHDSPTGKAMTPDAEEIVTEALRDLARWLYRRLEAEYEYLTSDAETDAALEANAYTFTENGRRFG